MHYAANNGHRDVVALLLEGGANSNLTDMVTLTAIHTVHSSSTNSNGVCLQDGRTALYWAAKNGHHVVVALLLDWGANPNLANKVFIDTYIHSIIGIYST